MCRAAAEWMLRELEEHGQVVQAEAAEHIASHFEGLVQPTEVGGSSIDRKVIDTFKKMALKRTGRPVQTQGAGPSLIWLWY